MIAWAWPTLWSNRVWSPQNTSGDRTSGDAATFGLGCLDRLTWFPFRLQCEQWKLTRAAREAEPLAEMHSGWVADNVHQTDDKITLTLKP